MSFQKGCIPWNKGEKSGNHGNGFKKGFPSAFKGKKHTQLAKEKNRIVHLGKKVLEKTREKLSKNALSRPNFIYYWRGKTGNLSANWRGGINRRKRKNERNDSTYHEWVRLVKKRDDNICKLKDKNCFGYNIVHHVRSWKYYPKLRYELSNGITLCQAHHPKSRAEEKQLENIFYSLIGYHIKY